MLISLHLASYELEAFIGRSRRERAQIKCVLVKQDPLLKRTSVSTGSAPQGGVKA
jgi:hypothetical protein